MKKKVVKKSVKEQNTTRCHKWLWITIAFILGGVIGYVAHYTVINWSGFFVTCPDGAHPDKNGCCAGEVYTDAGDGWMVCCPDGGDNCFPPMK
ncbi:MAG: hypothetical protein IK122_02235 [Alphaproteobacteria bacterium]|nr:hypothetical protein [Alphaproteobacteria bacterium]